MERIEDIHIAIYLFIKIDIWKMPRTVCWQCSRNGKQMPLFGKTQGKATDENCVFAHAGALLQLQIHLYYNARPHAGRKRQDKIDEKWLDRSIGRGIAVIATITSV